MNIKSSSLLVVAERHYREHLKSKPQDDDEAAMLAITAPLAKELGRELARWVLLDPELPNRLKQVRDSLTQPTEMA